MTQYLGTAHGALLDPLDLTPFLGTEAGVAALRTFAELARLAPPLSSAAAAAAAVVSQGVRAPGGLPDTVWQSAMCNPWGSTLFHQGRCAFTVGMGYIWKTAQVDPGLTPALGTRAQPSADSSARWFVRGRVGVAMLPGSALVYNRTSGRLQDCTATLCKYGADGQPEQITQFTDGQEVYVNRAPYSPTTGGHGTSTAACALFFDMTVF